MSIAAPTTIATPEPARRWLAELDLTLEARAGKTALVGALHQGPLRVQRPFYPEGPECCHVYLLHPPGGMVVGDELRIQIHQTAGCHSLLTTPSAGRLYRVPGGGQAQTQTVRVNAGAGSFIEWLPQETLVFAGAHGTLHTCVQLQGDAQALLWDIVCLGRPASQLPFTQGSCTQRIELWHDDELVFIEHNRFNAEAALLSMPWGLAGCHTSGTLLATVTPARTLVDQWVSDLSALSGGEDWGLTQKQNLFIARYRGNSALACRRGFEFLWRQLRPIWCKRPAFAPRIWAT